MKQKHYLCIFIHILQYTFLFKKKSYSCPEVHLFMSLSFIMSFEITILKSRIIESLFFMNFSSNVFIFILLLWPADIEARSWDELCFHWVGVIDTLANCYLTSTSTRHLHAPRAQTFVLLIIILMSVVQVLFRVTCPLRYSYTLSSNSSFQNTSFWQKRQIIQILYYMQSCTITYCYTSPG